MVGTQTSLLSTGLLRKQHATNIVMMAEVIGAELAPVRFVPLPMDSFILYSNS
jgi:hypothetical protein